MSQRPHDLPDFETPPLVEVVLSVQFAELRQYRIIHAGLLWQTRFRENYPHVSEQPPLPPTFETFGPQPGRGLAFEFSSSPGMPVPRLWFISKDQEHLVQVQSDRFVHNWRKNRASANYPRYEVIKSRFFGDLSSLRDFFRSEQIGDVVPNQCEVTYVNHVYGTEDHDIRAAPERAIRLWSTLVSSKDDVGEQIPRLEDMGFTTRHILEGEDGQPVGRLLVTAQPSIDNDQKPIIRLDLTARGVPPEPNLDGVNAFFDKGRDIIVRAFTAITTPEMHRVWGRFQ